MKQAQEPSKRIVSKGEHIQSMVERTVAIMSGLGLYFVACMFALAVIYCIYFRIYQVTHHKFYTSVQVQSFWTLLCFSPFALYFIVKMGHSNLRYASTLDVGVPLTRANTADLPAPDSLVRASQEPAQEQEAVLLRAAAAEAQEGQKEQLLRPSGGWE